MPFSGYFLVVRDLARPLVAPSGRKIGAESRQPGLSPNRKLRVIGKIQGIPAPKNASPTGKKRTIRPYATEFGPIGRERIGHNILSTFFHPIFSLLLQTPMAEGQGFEPWEALTSLVFKTSAFDHSATPPGKRILFGSPRRIKPDPEFTSSDSHLSRCAVG